jgi:UDP-2,3-diacylglucosamine pyrophosphatase LpxH
VTAPIRLPLPNRLRTVFISDLHLGSANCHADALAEFLADLTCQRLYLVGDIVDLWWMAKRRAAWSQHQTRVLDALRTLARDGTELIYIPGNHDRPLRHLCGTVLPQMKIRRRAVHVTADGRRLLVTHGDEFDAVTHLGGLHEWFGDKLYGAILAGNRLLNRLRRRLGLRYWSLAEYLKQRSGAAERYIERFVQACAADARRRALDGVLCGHIHRPALREVDGLIYANDGDWVESLSAITEDGDGTLALVHWNRGSVHTLATLPPRLVLRALDLAA